MKISSISVSCGFLNIVIIKTNKKFEFLFIHTKVDEHKSEKIVNFGFKLYLFG